MIMDAPKIKESASALQVSDIMSLSLCQKIVSSASIVEVRGRVLSCVFKRAAICEEFKNDLYLSVINNDHISLMIPSMNIDLEGVVESIKLKDNKTFCVDVRLSNSLPDYWVDCLIDFLPKQHSQKQTG